MVLGAHECRGSGNPSRIATEEFRTWTDSNNLIHLATRGSQFTWSNGTRGSAYTEKRLDKTAVNEAWISFWSAMSCCTLTRNKSDHFPSLLNMKKEVSCHISSCKFMKMWANHPHCHKIITEALNIPVSSCLMFILSQKLKIVKLKLKEWNKTCFGDVNLRVSSAEAKVFTIQAELNSRGFLGESMLQEKEAQSELQQALHYQEEFWLEKSRLDWNLHGDSNTEYFHKLTKIRCVTKQISLLKIVDRILFKAEDIEQHVVKFYEDLFASNNSCVDNGMIEGVIPNLVTAEDNNFLTKLPSVEEVKNVVFSMNGNGAPGLDGFGGFFFQHFLGFNC